MLGARSARASGFMENPMPQLRTSFTLEELGRAASLVYRVMLPTPLRMAQAAQSGRLHGMGET
jgi:hypothetical protein